MGGNGSTVKINTLSPGVFRKREYWSKKMKKKAILATAMAGVTLATAFMFACGKKEDVWDAGEYGTLTDVYNSTGHVKANPGYKFIGWSEPVKNGNKTVYTAQYLQREYYLSEVRDVYEYKQNENNCGVSLKYKTTNMQTGEVDYEVDEQVITFVMNLKCSTSATVGTNGTGLIYVNSGKEFDTIVTITVDDSDYNINQQFTMHCVRNRIPAESVELYTLKDNHELKLGSFLYFFTNILPEDTSFVLCTLKVVRVVRDGVDLSEEEAAQVAYFKNNAGLMPGDDAQVGDILWVQAENQRDPEIKSDLFAVTIVQ